MNQRTTTKLKLIFSGLSSRFQENQQLFKHLRFTFKSGRKSFQGHAQFSEGKLTLHFKGSQEEISFDELLNQIHQEASLYDALQLSYEERGHVMEVLADDKDVKVKNRELDPDQIAPEPSPVLNRAYLINHQQARPLLTELDILTKDGKIKNDKIRKYSQIDHYVEILLNDLNQFKHAKHPIHIVDCGCGKSYLSFVLNYYMTEVLKIKTTFTGIDISEQVIESSKQMADRLGYRNMRFIQGDIRHLITKQRPDIVMSLHACDTATDLALNFGVRNKADLIIAVPCCHAEMNRSYDYAPFASILKHGILKRRMADVLTDGLRCLILEQEGYDTTIREYISPLETPKNLLIKARRTGKRSQRAEDELMSLILDLDYAPALYRYLNDLDGDEDQGTLNHHDN